MNWFETSRLVKSEDLNHHHTLFAGRLAEWFSEATFMSASRLFGKYGDLDHLVAVEIHSMKFLAASFSGDVLRFTSRGIQAGTTSVTVYTKALRNNTGIKVAEGFVTFVCLDAKKHKIPHGIILPGPETEEDRELLASFNRLSKTPRE